MSNANSSRRSIDVGELRRLGFGEELIQEALKWKADGYDDQQKWVVERLTEARGFETLGKPLGVFSEHLPVEARPVKYNGPIIPEEDRQYWLDLIFSSERKQSDSYMNILVDMLRGLWNCATRFYKRLLSFFSDFDK